MTAEPVRPRALYAVPAGDLYRNFTAWQEGRRDSSQVALTYSHLFYRFCLDTGRDGIVSAPDAARRRVEDGRFAVAGRAPTRRDSTAHFLAGYLRNALAITALALRSGAREVILMDGVTFAFLLWPLSLAGRRIYRSDHTVLRPAFRPLSATGRAILALEGWFLRHGCAGALAVSDQIRAQLRALAPNLPVLVFNPTYVREDFADMAPASWAGGPFHVVFAGRIEASKGVFDLVAMMKTLLAEGRDVVLDICGEGGQFAQLAAAVTAEGLDNAIRLHGHVSRDAMLGHLARAQVVIVPTRTDFVEGLNKVVIEAVLARRPVITSAVCPALDLVREAAVEARPDDVTSYADAVRRLMDDAGLRTTLSSATETVRERFFDPAFGWAAKAAALLG